MGFFENLLKKNNDDDIKKTSNEVKPKTIEIVKPLEQKQEQKIKKNPEKIICNDIIRQQLDSQQLAAVESPLGNTCVFAIAGSGKTRVLTYRVANLIDNNIPESEMLLLTFTNKAADEMTDRIKTLLNKKKLNLMSGTFHSIASNFLREYAQEIGYKRNYKIITPGVQKSLIETCRNDYLEKYLSGFNNEEFPSKNIIADIYS